MLVLCCNMKTLTYNK